MRKLCALAVMPQRDVAQYFAVEDLALERWNDISRGHDKWVSGPTANSETIGIAPALTGTEFTHEGLYVNQHANWQRFLLEGLARKALNLKEVE